MTVLFSLDKNKVKQAFAHAVLTYDSVTQLQRTVGRELLRQLESIVLPEATLVDLGCGTGFLTTELIERSPCQRMIALDLAWPMLQMARSKLVGNACVSYVCADAEHLPFIGQSVDAVVSNLMLQWCADLKTVFTEIQRVLKPSGYLVFSIFGPKTLVELKQAWATVDDYRHVNDFYDSDTLTSFLQQSGFAVVSQQQHMYISQYESVWALMRELKAIGAHNVNVGRNKRLTTKSQLHKMMDAYPKHNVAGGIAATFEVMTFVARRD